MSIRLPQELIYSRRCLYTILSVFLLVGGCQKRTVETADNSKFTLGSIEGDSMAPTLLGLSRIGKCSECGFGNSVSAEKSTNGSTTVCCNCGAAGVQLNQVNAGDSVTIQKRKDYVAKRFDIVAFLGTAKKNDFKVKRVIGLPNESVGIRNGNLIIDDQLYQKSISEQRKTSILVHDANFSSQKKRRWKLIEREKIAYQHFRSYESMLGAADSIPIDDSYGFNHSLTRSLNQVSDVAISCEIDFEKGDVVHFSIVGTKGSCTALIDIPKGMVSLNWGTHQMSKRVSIDLDRPVPIYFSNFDQRISLSVGESFFYAPRSTNENGTLDVSELDLTNIPIQISGIGEIARIRNVKIYRDIYLLGKHGDNQPWTANCGANEFIVFGDNQPVSIDSRQWERPAIKIEQIFGCL